MASLLLSLGAGSILRAQITDPLPPILPSGLSVELEHWLTIPASSGSSVKARINHLKPCPDGTRLFCNDLRGQLWVIADKSASTATEFLDLRDHFPSFVDTPGLGAGFTSFDFHPEFDTLSAPGYGKFYTSHTEAASGTLDFTGPESSSNSQVGIITEWTLNDAEASAITLGPDNFTRREIVRIGFAYHIHGLQEIAFDPNATPTSENYGCLFICVGDGGALVAAVDEPNNTGSIDSALGTILRITPLLATGHTPGDFSTSANGAYLIPSTNPFINSPDPRPSNGAAVVREIYAYGFRNPHRISWDRSGSHKMFCGNIGENSIEEIELVVKGGNHGWPNREGAFLIDPDVNDGIYPIPFPDDDGLTYPVSQYDRGEGDVAVVGGFVYRGSDLPALEGKYLFGDIKTGRLFVTDEADMTLQAVTFTGDTPAPPQHLNIKSAGTQTTFLSILGKSRADLRFGIDHDGEFYLLSKQNGGIYRVLEDPDPSGTAAAPTGSPTDWALLRNFENGEHELITQPTTTAQIVDDPIEGSANRSLRIRSNGSQPLDAHLPIPEIPDGGHATLFFRFLTTDSNHSAVFGISDQENPSSSSDLITTFRSGDQNATPPSLEVRNGSSFQSIASLIPNHWYSVWVVIDHDDDVWDLYLEGGDYSAATLIRTRIPFPAGSIGTLKSFFWQLSPGSNAATTSAIYFDDLHIDVGHANLLAPPDPVWHLIDHFEGPNPLSSWQLPNSGSQSASIITEADGNRYLQRAASSTSAANPLAIAARELPFATQVGQSLTLFLRVRADSTDLLQSVGLSALNPPDSALYTESDLAAQLRISPPGTLELFGGVPGVDDFISTTPPSIDGNTWYKIWLVCSNRGIASGGQTWRAWIKGGPYLSPTPLGEEIYFRTSAEAPITHFLSFASSLTSARNDPLSLDDLYLFPGITLDDPLGEKALRTSISPLTPTTAAVTCPTRPNHALRLFFSDDLDHWSPVGDFVEGDGSAASFVQPVDVPWRFFQVVEHSPRKFYDTTWTSTFPDSEAPRGLRLSPGSTWTFGENLVSLDSIPAQVSGMVRRPGAYVLTPGEWRNLTLTIEARTLEPETTVNRDICLVFGYQDETHFYYVHLSSLSDGLTHNVIMKVNGSTRTAIQSPAMPSPALGSAWHSFRLTHAADGHIAVYVDGSATPAMTALDTDFRSGAVGFGSFNDPAEFRLIEISGQSR
ncbi:PQQ-dependent sugar dehydrogenase [Haloferula sp.]|uniref:PQQ-dependent sugar dehydrogenase n=1 Tax=Haloferula sp. TaxID=2497595 RepID=UPI003C7287AD